MYTYFEKVNIVFRYIMQHSVEFLSGFSRSFSAKSRGEKQWSARTYAKSRGVFSAKVRI